LAYPIVRAVSVLLVVPLAAGVSGETLSLTSLAGIGLIAASLLLLAAGNFGPGAVPVTAFAWICLAAAATAAYVFCDAQGARWAGSPWAYGLLVCITNALALAWTQRRTAPPWRLLADHWTMAVPSAVAAMTSYLLILWVWSGAPIAPAAALRDTSAIFAVVIAVLWLGEPFTRLRLAAILLSAAAVPLLRFA
jgi:drug/metabolite transporter (DMT)-like permease